MNRITIGRIIFSGVILLGPGVMAAPSVPVTKPPATPAVSYTGPVTADDSHAVMGQWFQSITNQNLLGYRTHEFYDNTASCGGGSRGHLAIEGRVTNIVNAESYPGDLFPPILSFEVIARVFNDGSPTNSGACADGVNNLGEQRHAGIVYSNTLYEAILTVDFATAGTFPATLFANSPPYRNAAPYIAAINHDFVSWYGWNSDNNQNGDFCVPGWNLGTLLPGQSTNITLIFVVQNDNNEADRIDLMDPRYSTLVDSATSGTDIFINRTTSLKINEWIRDPSPDNGSAYPAPDSTNLNNVSVFHFTAEDVNQSIAIKGLNWTANPSAHCLSSVGSSGITRQILQSCTNLPGTNTINWFDVYTNERAWPMPKTNYWTNTTFTGSVHFYRIRQ